MPKVVIDYRPPRGRVSVTPSWTISLMEKAKAIPGRKKFSDRVMHFELSPENVAFVRAAFPMAESIGYAQNNGKGLATGHRMTFRTAYEPTPLQDQAFTLSRGKRLFAFFEKPGAGKTKMLLDRAVDMWCSGEIDGLFVFSYSGVHEQWVKDEIPKHVHPDIPVMAEYWRTGKKMSTDILKPDGSKFRVLTMNYEAYAVSDKAFSFAKKFALSGNIAAAADESQRFKGTDSIIAEKAIANREDWKARFIASGEPTPLGIQDYYQQFCFLDPSIIGAWTYEGFRSMYCRMGGHQNTKIVGYQNQENLHRLMAPYVHVGAPSINAEKIYEVSRFDLGPRARAAYNELKEEMLVTIDERRVHDVRSVLPMLMKLSEISCGRLTARTGEIFEFEPVRMDLLKTILAINEGQKAIIWARFVADHIAIAEALGDKAAVFNGQTKDKERREIISSFLERGSGLQYLISSTGAAGTGWNLQGGCNLNIYYSNSNNAGQRWQSEMRTFRIGTERDVRYIDIVARNTVDVGTLNSNRRKREVSDMSIEEFRALIEETEVIDLF